MRSVARLAAWMSSAVTDAVVVGAGPAGLAVAACLRRLGVEHEVLERANTVGSAWRGSDRFQTGPSTTR